MQNRTTINYLRDFAKNISQSGTINKYDTFFYL